MVSSTAAPIARSKKGYREYATVATRPVNITLPAVPIALIHVARWALVIYAGWLNPTIIMT
ncbi:hypothetical protein KDAU_21260 [Dictyobacter aurantiacus]|uniref:Uncharacterized protein n=1 Tax=Dictyobacter aurantiacus TaxID=1936993 RepID=A0A401ZD41_9CHLR|nr:hypothetical protein KDAU_21260 [Dictyobacter aurantiacus]